MGRSLFHTGELRRIRQVILFVSPNFGSRIISWLRMALSLLLSNWQKQALRLQCIPEDHNSILNMTVRTTGQTLAQRIPK